MTVPSTWIHRTPKGLYAGDLDGPRRAYRPDGMASVLAVLVLTDFRGRYRGQALGLVWSLLYPLAMMGLLTVVVGDVARFHVDHYPIFLLIGLVFWQYVTRSLSNATRAFVRYRNIAKRATFPRYIMPIAAVISQGLGSVIEFVLVLGLGLLFRGSLTLGWAWLLLPVFAVLLTVLLAGLSLATATLFAFFRDFAFLVETGLLFLYWGTPILYPMDALSPRMQQVVELNPFGALLVSTRSILMNGTLPDNRALLLAVTLPLIALAAGAFVFRIHASRLPDQL